MNGTDWKKVEAFALDSPTDNYGFGTRLADENSWSINFTERAILEYKKFMFLAATAGKMVSPSEVVDIVWHQHLIFTNSYHAFAQVLGKRIEHIPSTHNPEEREQFEFAKKRTAQLYNEHFGEQPDDIWTYKSLEQQLQAIVGPAPKMNKQNSLGAIFLAFALLYYPLSLLYKPLLLKVGNPDFLLIYLAIAIVTLVLLELSTSIKLQAYAKFLYQKGIVDKLHPFELTYLQTNKFRHVIHGIMDSLVEKKQVGINADYKLSIQKVEQSFDNPFKQNVYDSIRLNESIHYPVLLSELEHKPMFSRIRTYSDKLRKAIQQTRPFLTLFAMRWIVFLFLLIPV